MRNEFKHVVDCQRLLNYFLEGNYANMLGYGDNQGMKEYLRLYISLHGDHEGMLMSLNAAIR